MPSADDANPDSATAGLPRERIGFRGYLESDIARILGPVGAIGFLFLLAIMVNVNPVDFTNALQASITPLAVLLGFGLQPVMKARLRRKRRHRRAQASAAGLPRKLTPEDIVTGVGLIAISLVLLHIAVTPNRAWLSIGHIALFFIYLAGITIFRADRVITWINSDDDDIETAPPGTRTLAGLLDFVFLFTVMLLQLFGTAYALSLFDGAVNRLLNLPSDVYVWSSLGIALVLTIIFSFWSEVASVTTVPRRLPRRPLGLRLVRVDDLGVPSASTMAKRMVYRNLPHLSLLLMPVVGAYLATMVWSTLMALILIMTVVHPLGQAPHDILTRTAVVHDSWLNKAASGGE